jgi:hypothetical protein
MSLFDVWDFKEAAHKLIEARRRVYEVERRSRTSEVWVPNIINHTVWPDGSLHTSSNQGVIRIKEFVTYEEGVTAAKHRLDNFRSQCKLFGAHQVRRPDHCGSRSSF